MTFYLRHRAQQLTERMDDLSCDPEKLARTYTQFAQVNRLLAGWTSLYRRELRPALQAGAQSVLDIGCGGGDIVRYLAGLAHRDGLSPTFLGIDPDPRAIAFARAQENLHKVRFEQADLTQFSTHADIVLSNHLLHHLTDDEIRALCAACERLANVCVLHNDIRRSDLALVLFPIVGGCFRDSFILEDGRRSIRRAFTVQELEDIVPGHWKVHATAPFRIQLQWKP